MSILTSPSRLFRSWLDSHQIEVRRQLVERQLSLALRTPLLLEPVHLRGGHDRMYVARTTHWQSEVIAGIRLNCLTRSRSQPDPCLPRRALSPQDRLQRESLAYQRLAGDGLAPQLIARGPVFLANRWLPWPRVSQVLKQCPECLWSILPVILDAITRMHDLGVTHLDLNCGNLLIAPGGEQVALIDFEYAPASGVSFLDQCRFDFLRLAHDMLRPRRGLAAISRDPNRFVAMLASAAPRTHADFVSHLNPRGFFRLFEHSRLGAALTECFGVDACNIVG